jgi:hypothetical protein
LLGWACHATGEETRSTLLGRAGLGSDVLCVVSEVNY